MIFKKSPIAIIGDMFSNNFNMKASYYFNDAEIELTLALVGGLLEDEKTLQELSIEFDAGEKLIELRDKIDFYFNDMKNESPQE
jgi:hypothetical protein